MKKKLLLLAVLLCTAVAGANAAIDESLSTLITTSSDVTITEVTNDEAYPWTVTDGVATNTNGKTSTENESAITIKFSCSGPTVLSHKYTLDCYNYYEYRRIYVDGLKVIEANTNTSDFTQSTLYRRFEAGEHEIRFAYYHRYTTSSYTQTINIRDIDISSVESKYKTIALSAPGTLGNEALALVNTLPEMDYLRLSGKMNSDDWSQITKMTGLKAIDMTDAEVTDIPASAFENTVLRFVELPKTLKTIGNRAFYDRYLTGKLILPEGLESMGEYAFYNNLITEVTIPNSVTSMRNYLFYNNKQLAKVTLGDGCVNIPNYCFRSCDSLKTVNNCGSVKTIGNGAFYYCRILENLENMRPVTVGSEAFDYCNKLKSMDFSEMTSLSTEAFCNCSALEEVNLPNVISLGQSCFSGCTALKKVVIGDKIDAIPYYAFQSCSNLEEVVLGASVRSLSSYSFNIYNNNLKRLYINAPAPPTAESSTLYTTNGVTLYVPEYAAVSYKLHDYWSKFTSVDINPNKVNEITLYNKLELTSNARIPDTPNMTLNWANSVGGALIVNGNNPLTLNNYLHYISIGDFCPSLISRCNAMTSATSAINHYFAKSYWYYVCMPYDVRRSDITCTNNASLAVRYFDSESRAANGSGGNWKDVAADEILKEGQGYIFYVSADCYVMMPATEETHNNIFKSEAVTTSLNEYASQVSNDANWNLVGNPYPAFYDIYYMDYTAPITVWNTNNRTYSAYSVADDDFVLTPLQAFFVQKPTLVSGITFQPEGRQINKTIEHSAAAKALTPSSTNRKIVDLVLCNGSTEDRTRVVVNSEASDDFCPDNDASKMFANEGTPQIYTFSDNDMFAINEGSHASGRVNIGVSFPADGTYTFNFERNEAFAQLLDNGMAVEMPYTFNASEGISESRFTLSLDNSTNGITVIETRNDADNSLYTIGGVKVANNIGKGIYIKNNKKIVK